MTPDRRYQAGLEIASMDSQEEWGDSPEDKVIKRFFVKATADSSGTWHLVALVAVEVVAIKNGEDEGWFEFPVTTSQLPFPFDCRLRKQLLRDWRANPPFHRA